MRPRSSHSSFERLSLACRVALTGEGLAAWREATASTPDWQALLEAARAERVGPLLAHACERAELPDGPPVPEEVRAALRREHLVTAGKAAILAEAASRLLAAFARAGLPVIALKGLALAETVYPNPALRPMEDLDILVRTGDLPAAVRILTEAGYREAWHGFPDFQQADGLVDVDLHTALLHEGEIPTRLGAQAIATDELWAAAQLATIAGVSGLILSPSHQLLHLCQHLCYHHGLSGLLRHADILALATRHPEVLAADRLEPLAAGRPGRRALFHALSSCERRLDMPLPPGMLRVLRPADLSWMEERLHGREAAPDTGAAGLVRYYLLLRSLPTRRQRLRLLWELGGAWWRRGRTAAPRA